MCQILTRPVCGVSRSRRLLRDQLVHVEGPVHQSERVVVRGLQHVHVRQRPRALHQRVVRSAQLPRVARAVPGAPGVRAGAHRELPGAGVRALGRVPLARLRAQRAAAAGGAGAHRLLAQPGRAQRPLRPPQPTAGQEQTQAGHFRRGRVRTPQGDRGHPPDHHGHHRPARHSLRDEDGLQQHH